jgi:PHD/YefM family antitoxin component YafN of YafNO toxin-antitoxin module
MRTLDLRQQQVSVADLLQCARTETVCILNEDGEAFILEAADAFEREVAQLGESETFMAFLAERSKEPGMTSLDDLERKLSSAAEDTAQQ